MSHRLFLPALLLLSACTVNPAEQLADARQSFAGQDYDTARVLLTAALQAEPANQAALRLLIETYLRLGDGDAAQGAIGRLKAAGANGPELSRMDAEAALLRGLPKKALELLGPDETSDGWRIRAAALLDDNQTAAALEAFREGLTLNGSGQGDDQRLIQDYTRFLLATGDLAGAASQLTKLDQLGGALLSTQMLNGDLLVARQQFDLALAAYRKAAVGHPRRVEPLLGEATALGLLGKRKDAASVIETAAKLRPGDRRVIAMQVQNAAETGDWAKVREVLQPIESSLAAMSVENLTYAEALLQLGQAEQARARFARAHLVAPGNPYARLMLAAALLETGDPAGALAKVQPLADSSLASERELELAAAAARGAGQGGLADGYQRRFADATQSARARAVSGADAAFARGDFAAAITAYRQLPGFERDAEVLRRIAVATSRLSLHAEAIGLADRALQLDPASPAMLHAAGLVRLNAAAQIDQATNLLGAAAQAEPSNREFQRDLAKAKAAAR